MTAVGFVGLGTMGSALTARLLAAGWDVAGCDIDPARVAAHQARGGTVAAGPAGAAAPGMRGQPGSVDVVTGDPPPRGEQMRAQRGAHRAKPDKPYGCGRRCHRRLLRG